MMPNEVRAAAIGHQVVLHIPLRLWTLIRVPPLDRLSAKAEGARSAHRWLRMHQPLTWIIPPAEVICWDVATVIPNSFLGARSES